MGFKYGVLVIHIVATLLLIVLVAQIIFLSTVVLSFVGFSPLPLLEKNVDVNDSIISYRGNLYFILPLSTALVFPISYFIQRRRASVRGSARLYFYGAVVVIVILLVVFLAAYLGACGLGCAVLACGIGNVQECTARAGWLYVELVCKCK